MADVSAQPIPDWGSLLSSYGQGQANIGLTNSQANLAQAQATQSIPAQAGLARAQTGLAGAQTNLVGAQAQKANLEVKMIQKAMADAEATQNSNQQGSDSDIDPTQVGVSSYLNNSWFVDPKGPASLQPYLQNPALAAAFPQVVQRADEMRKIAVESATAKNQNEANDVYQTASTLMQNDGGAPLQSLLKLKDGSKLNLIGKAINGRTDMTQAEKDQAAEAAIESAAKTSFRFTGQKPTVVGDQERSEQTGQPVAGAPGVRPSPGEQISSAQWARTPQTATVNGRDTTTRPIDLGINGAQDLLKDKRGIKFSSPPPSDQQAPIAGGGNPQTASPQQPTPGGGQGTAPTGKQPPISKDEQQTQALRQAGLNDPQIDFVKSRQPGFPQIPSNEKPNPDDLKARDIYRAQAQKLSDATNTEFARAQDTVTHMTQIKNLLNTPGLKLGPGSQEYSQLQTIFNQWTGSSAGQAGAYQVLTKVLNATEMNDLLQQFHSEGAQVRLGAYESRLIMEKLTANPNLTKEAINQMLKWQQSDAQYTLDKSRTAAATIAAGKSVANFNTEYGTKFPKQDIVDTSVSQLNGGKSLNFDGAKGKSYQHAEVSASAAKLGMPVTMLEDQLRKAGANIQ
jgi:hypothetical protein